MKGTHFLGIGGVGMSALAHILLDRGEIVSGVDFTESATLSALRGKGALIEHSLAAPKGSRVVYSSAIGPDQLRALKEPLHRSEFLSLLLANSTSLLVAGSHGKTSTSGLLTWVLESSGRSPTFAIGGKLLNLGVNGGAGRGDLFVAEADESDGSFRNYSGTGAILTNLDRDHMDYWGNIENLEKGFEEFAQQILNPELFFWCAEDTSFARLRLPGRSYSIDQFAQEGEGISFSAVIAREVSPLLFLPQFGRHQALNGAGVYGMARALGLSHEEIQEGFSSYKGMGRRMEKVGEARGITVYDDYAHHPTEIEAVLGAIQTKGRVIALFQPHRYTRTREHQVAFEKALAGATHSFVTEIYGAGEEPIPGVSAEGLAKAVGGTYVPKAELLTSLLPTLKAGDVVITLGAGDITQLGPKIVEALRD